MAEKTIKKLTARTTPVADRMPVKVSIAKRKVIFIIYYKAKDNAFQKAAKTILDSANTTVGWNLKLDVIISKEVLTESDFKKIWGDLYETTKKGNYEIVQGHILTHASKPANTLANTNSGLEFKSNIGFDDATLKLDELKKLEKLPWAKNAHLILYGCNTGKQGVDREWSPASILAKSQGVVTTGQIGYAYFSTSNTEYIKIAGSSSKVYLWAFNRGKNNAIGDGSKIPAKDFQ